MKPNGIRGSLWTALFAVIGLISGTANAVASSAAEYEFADELNRCVSLLRPSVQAFGDGKVVYDVQDYKRTGPWYRFEISVSVEDEAGTQLLDNYRVGCSSNRWVDSAYLSSRRNSQQLPKRLTLASQ